MHSPFSRCYVRGISLHVIHSFAGKHIDEHTSRDVAFFLTNKKGNYISLGAGNFTHMQGLHFFDASAWTTFKTIEDIRLSHKPQGIRNLLHAAERLYKDGATESFSLFNNSMCYRLKSYHGEVFLDLDFRHMFDYDDRGRIYSISQDGEFIVIRYEKFSDFSLQQKVRTKYLVIAGASEFRQIGEWQRKEYPYDLKRRARSEFYIYKALALECRGSMDLVFSFSDRLDEAKNHAANILDNLLYFQGSMKSYMQHSFTSPDISLNVAMKALDDLLVTIDNGEKRTGIFAGYPWFHQFWARDELLSLKAFILQEKFSLAKSIIFRYLSMITEEGLVPNRLPRSELRSIDAVGWLFVRVKDLLDHLAAKRQVDKYLSHHDLVEIRQSLEKAIEGLLHSCSDGGLIAGRAQESWMDTKEARRSGAFIEVQAMFLQMVRLHGDLVKLTKTKPLFKGMEKDYKERVRKAFFKDGKLKDSIGSESDEDRPNLFVAYYIYPDLLSVAEWRQAFDSAIKTMWLDWGGFSSISHLSHLFRQEYTGEFDESYHNGDSWYFVNNLAAISMARLDKKHFSKYIKRIEHASKEELLFSGFAGCSAEVSSAKAMRSEGCLTQAWSLATYIELMFE